MVEGANIAGTQKPLRADQLLRERLLLLEQADGGGTQAAVRLECLVEALKAIEISLGFAEWLNPFQWIQDGGDVG